MIYNCFQENYENEILMENGINIISKGFVHVIM